MRFLAILGLALYGAANLFVGIYDWTAETRLVLHVELLLIVSGAILIGASFLVTRRSKHALALGIVSLLLAFGIAVYNERVQGQGHPGHHLVRAAYTLIVFWAVWRSTRAAKAGLNGRGHR